MPPKRPVSLTERTNRFRVKLAVTARAPPIVTVQVVPETASQPLHAANIESKAGVAIRVTTVPLL